MPITCKDRMRATIRMDSGNMRCLSSHLYENLRFIKELVSVYRHAKNNKTTPANPKTAPRIFGTLMHSFNIIAAKTRVNSTEV